MLRMTFLAAVLAVPAGFTETPIASGLDRPVALAWLPDGRLLIGEQFSGNILLYRNGAVQPAPYATVSPLYTGNVEAGLRGLAVDPGFATNGFVYAVVSQAVGVQRVLRFTTVGDTGVAPVVLIDNLPLGDRHNGGGIGFGPDGMLYVSTGDTDNGPLADNPASLAGKILRYAPDGTPAAGNPWGNAVWCRGLRNPFRFAWDASGRMYGTDNGLFSDDEINYLQAGGHYGWPFDSGPNADPTMIDPVHTFPVTVAPSGILVYGGATMPFAGQVFAAEWSTNRVRRFVLNAPGDRVVSGPTDFATNVAQPVDLVEGPDGAIYYSTLGGEVYRAQANGAGNLAPSASFTVAPQSGAPPLAVTVDASASADVDGAIVSTAWSWGDGTPDGAGTIAAHTYTGAGVFTITLTVTDDQGATGTATRDVVVTAGGNSPPSAHIEDADPLQGTAPLTVVFSGHAHDDTGPVDHRWDFGDGSALVVETGVPADESRSQVRTYSAPGAYVCALTATDPGGVSDTHTVTITVTAPPARSSGGGGSCGLLGLEALLALLLGLRRRTCRG